MPSRFRGLSSPLRSRRSFLKAVTGGTAGAMAGGSGCTAVFSNGEGTPTRTSNPSNGTITLEYVDVAGARSKEVFQPVVDELNDLYSTDIRLEFTEIPYENMKRQLLTRLGGGNAPDIAAIDQIWLGAFIDSGTLLPLSGVADDIEFGDYLDAFASSVQQDGIVYGLPITTDVRGMYWNKNHFEQVGLDPEQPPRTWSGVLDAAAQIHDPPNTYGSTYFVVAGRWSVNLFAAGGRFFDADETEPRFDDPSGVRAASFIDDVYNGSKVGPPDPVYQNGAQMAREFLNGQFAINIVEGSWLDFFWRNLGRTNDEMVDQFGFATTPAPDGDVPKTMSGGFTWAGFSSTEHPDIVEDFLRIAGGKEFKRHLAIETRDIPTRASLLDDRDIWDRILYGETIKGMLSDTETRPIRHWPVIEERLNSALQRVAFDRAEPEDALSEAADHVRRELR